MSAVSVLEEDLQLRPAPRNASELLTKASQSIQTCPTGANLGCFPAHAARNNTTLVANISNSPVSSRLTADLNTIGCFNTVTPSDLLQPPRGISRTNEAKPATSGSVTQVLTWLERADYEFEGDNDPEDIQVLLCPTPPINKNVKENTLPFVLYCYAQWARTSAFEPLKIVQALRDQVITQFSSEITRTRTILVANVMMMFTRNLALDNAREAILNHLALDVRKSGFAFIATSPSFVLAWDRQNATTTLDTMLEIVSLQIDIQPFSESFRTLDYAAPVFRRACSEPAGEPVNLPNLLLDPSLNLRHFVTSDILISVTTGQSTYFQYAVPFSLELCERVYSWQQEGNYGSQWYYGLPDQFILLIAWINALSETPDGGNPEFITWVEHQLPQIKIAVDESGDPSLRITRMVVLEAWRFAVLIYLYMVLCKANAHDLRVVRAQKGFMRLVSGIKPGRQPDLFLALPMAVAGVATTKKRDQDTLRQRILNIREYSDRRTAGGNIVPSLEDIWVRTKNEGRAAVWGDLKLAYTKLTGRCLSRNMYPQPSKF